MIEFHPLRIEDRATIERYTLPSGSRNCDLAFANMYCWQELYRSAWAIIDDFLVIRFHIDGGTRIGYTQPLGPGDFTPIIPLLRDDARTCGNQPLRLFGLTDEGCALLRDAFPDAFACASDRSFDDYIYLADDLRNLPGRRYQPKRNHFNRFRAEYPDHRYEELTPARFAECMTLERQWRRAHEGHISELCAEQRAMQRAFDHFDALGLRGGCLYVGERLVAFTYGSAVSGDTFVTHVEKADTAFEGAFTAINKLFAEHLPERFRWINREEDLGIEGLRHAKLSYHPAELFRKFSARELCDNEKACKELWQTVFGDNEAFIDAFLLRHYAPQRMLSVERDGHMVSMLHILPFECEAGRASYIYGVATHPDFRCQGFASQLMQQAVELCDRQGDDALFLIPTPGMPQLRDFYARFGFTGSLPVAFRTPDGFDFGTGSPADDLAMLRLRNPQAAFSSLSALSSLTATLRTSH